MNSLMITALVVVALWLGVLTLVVILTIRQIALLTVRFAAIGQALPTSDDTFSLADDGPEVGSSIPEEVWSQLPELGQQPAYVLLLSANCTPCRDLASQLHRQRFDATVTALIAGHEEVAAGLAALLPPGIHTVRDPEATALAKALHIQSTPFAVAIKDGIVISKEYIYGIGDFIRLVASKKVSDDGKASDNFKEANHVA